MRAHRVILPLAAVLTLAAACGSSTPAATPAAGAGASRAVAPSGATPGPVTQLRTGDTSVGKVVTDENGRTLYLFTKDTQGGTSSACTGGPCLAAWPPALMGASLPALTGVSGKVGTIATAQGQKQLTLNGWPLYYFAKDTSPGDITGQDVQGVWFVLDPSGKAQTATASSQDQMGGY